MTVSMRHVMESALFVCVNLNSLIAHPLPRTCSRKPTATQRLQLRGRSRTGAVLAAARIVVDAENHAQIDRRADGVASIPQRL